MVRKLTLSVGLLIGCAWCLALVVQASEAQPGESTGSFKPVASVHGLMNGQGLLFKSINDALTNPATPQRLERIEVYAESLAELANVNTHNSDKEDYRRWAGQLRDTAMELAKEAAREGVDDPRMKNIFARVKAACDACHDVYQ